MAQALDNSNVQSIQQKSQDYYDKFQQLATYFSTVIIEYYNLAIAFSLEFIKRTKARMDSSPPFRHFMYVFLTVGALPTAIFLITGGGIVISAFFAFVLAFVSVTGALLGVSALGLLAVLAVLLGGSLGTVALLYFLLFAKDCALYVYGRVLDTFSSNQQQLPVKPQNGPKYD
ncbi:hypothetical protein CONCODRAFT_76761 [Conidiobolus coronatus NRRL 28638]|uniref:Uncharacterized protein n=1 Tax=Conidiobolus coronatus (strain ATCC 28846 / CBS 209.66 / NRRL 28638) TaxID=796925 RepID=A0A137PI93_CONC2|nr:hypothetical protein CONCODRAFT_76761 [Conidiobolus coronatus NRRL 28638]|eukprot:KXN74718.1 hypothetical protein CONCODRAFT_76761 [Conidiobolus coronatus NRRL 28638]